MTHDYGGHHQPTVRDGYHDCSHNIRRFDDDRSDMLSNVGDASGMGYGTNTPAPSLTPLVVVTSISAALQNSDDRYVTYDLDSTERGLT